MKNETIILSTYNNKGGVAKSTYAGIFGLYLASQGKKVLLIDGDPQSNLTSRLYSYSHNNLTLGDLLLNASTKRMEDGIVKAFIPGYPTLDIIPANREMRYLEEVLLGINNTNERDVVIARWMRNNIDTVLEYDYVIWDVSPSTSILGRNILNTCNRILFVSEYNNIDSIEAVVKFINEFNQYKIKNNYTMPNYAVLINRYKKSSDADKLYQPFEDRLDIIKNNILNTKMIESAVIRNCNLYKQDIITYTDSNRINTKAKDLFLNIVEELDERGII